MNPSTYQRQGSAKYPIRYNPQNLTFLSLVYAGSPRLSPLENIKKSRTLLMDRVPLFNKYSKIAEEEDNKMADSWKADAEGVLVFDTL